MLFGIYLPLIIFNIYNILIIFTHINIWKNLLLMNYDITDILVFRFILLFYYDGFIFTKCIYSSIIIFIGIFQ